MGSGSSLRPSADKVDTYLRARGLEGRVREIPRSTRTARDAAQAMGCHISQIAKSVVFRGETSGRPILVIVSGANRVDEASMGARVGEGIQRADPEWVREMTGFPIGGVPPVAHRSPVVRYIDRDLLTHPEVYAAAGHPNALFRITPRELLGLVEAPVIQVDGPSPELPRDPGDPLPVSWITFDCYGTPIRRMVEARRSLSMLDRMASLNPSFRKDWRISVVSGKSGHSGRGSSKGPGGN